MKYIVQLLKEYNIKIIMENKVLEKKIQEMGLTLRDFKSNWIQDMQLINMMLGGSLALQLLIFLLLIFGDRLILFLGVSPSL